MRLAFAGTPEFAARALAALHGAGHKIELVLTQPDRPGGRGMNLQPSPVKQFAMRHGLAIAQPASLKHEDALATLRAANPESLVVAAYGLLLPGAVLQLPRHGAINIHASLLPRWRGAAPIQRALLAGDRETGISIMQMDEGLDTGPVLAMRSTPIAPEDDAGTLHDRLADIGAAMIVESLEALEQGRGSATPQPSAGATYARKIGKEDTVLDWAKPAAELERAVRAFRPAPGATTRLEGENVKVWRASVRPGTGAPGETLSTSEEGILIACGELALLVTELQRQGGRRLASGDFLRGRAVAPGMRFG